MPPPPPPVQQGRSCEDRNGPPSLPPSVPAQTHIVTAAIVVFAALFAAAALVWQHTPIALASATLMALRVPLWVRVLLSCAASAALVGYAWLAWRRPFELTLLWRATKVSVLFARVTVRYKLLRMRSRRVERKIAAAYTRAGGEAAAEAMQTSLDEEWASAHEVVGALMYGTLLGLGGLWVKIGQYIASRSVTDVTDVT